MCPSPAAYVHQVAESYAMQALLAEPGCAQKAFALLSYWEINGSPFNRRLVAQTVETLTTLHETRGLSSDVAWALAFAIQYSVPLTDRTAKLLSNLDDDVLTLLSLHANAIGLLPGFKKQPVQKALGAESCDGSRWLLLYESVAQGYLPGLEAVVRSDAFIEQLLAAKVRFYRTNLPPYSLVVHTGGAPTWVVKAWAMGEALAKGAPLVPDAIGGDLKKVGTEGKTPSEIVRELLGTASTEDDDSADSYS